MSLLEALSTLPLEMLLAAGFATYLVRYDIHVNAHTVSAAVRSGR